VILVLNCGSSSIKYRIFSAALEPRSGGLIEHVGEPGGPPTHADALAAAAGRLSLASGDLTAIGHRVIHGGATFTAPTLITDEVVRAIEELTPLAPLHNPPALAGIAVTRKARPDLPQVAIFDTAFHATLPPAAYT
jgi:acetate kinase